MPKKPKNRRPKNLQHLQSLAKKRWKKTFICPTCQGEADEADDGTICCDICEIKLTKDMVGEGVRRSGRPKKESVAEEESAPNTPNIDGLSLDDSNDGTSSGKGKKPRASKTEKALKNLRAKSDQNSKFFEDFNPSVSRREKLKTQAANKKPFSAKAKTNLYDAKGCLLQNGLDLCDCLDDGCPGCHFPCPKCRSSKCGHECRVNRKWQYDTVEIDGIPSSIKTNPHQVVLPLK